MTTQEFVIRLRELDIVLWVDQDRLRCSAPTGILTPELKAELAHRKTELVNYLKMAARAGQQSQAPAIVPNLRDGAPLPLSFAQERVWFLDQLEPGSAYYNIPVALRLKGQLKVSSLEQSLNAIVQRHEALRTTFGQSQGKAIQLIAPTLTLALPLIDLSALPEPERVQQLQKLARKEAQRPFDLTRGPLLRTTLMRLGNEEYVFLLNFHHIVSDGWSIGVFLRELAALYDAFSSGKPSPLSPLPVQYVDFACWQRQWLQDEVLEEQTAYWKQQLAGAPAVLDLPTDRPRPAAQTFRGVVHSLVLPKSLLQSLNSLCRQEQVTLFMTLLAAFQILLHRYAGQEDIVVGSPIANRNRAEIEELIGFFVNTLVLRTDFSGDPTFQQLLARVREVSLGAYAHQDLPFEKLVEVIQPPRDLSRSPLFQVMFVLQNAPLPPSQLGDLTLGFVPLDIGTAKFDLTLYMAETEQGLRASLEYNTDLFDESTVTRMAEHFKRLLEAIISNPRQRLHELPLLTYYETDQLLIRWNDTKMDYPEDRSLVALFEKQVEQTPDAVAVVFAKRKLTYRELNKRSNQLAHYLGKIGVRPGALVGICMERSAEMVVGLLGILKAGGAYLPLDPTYPSERLRFMLEDSEAQVLLTYRNQAEESLQNLITQRPTSTWGNGASSLGTNLQILRLDKDWKAISQATSANPREVSTAADLAYVIYTSGSTGKPKGVQISHRSVVNFLTSIRRQPGLTKNDVVLALTTLCFDIAGLELLLPLTTGARVVVLSREAAIDGKQLIRELERSQATVVQATPATWHLLLESGWQGNSNLKILCGGEAWSRDLAEQLLPRCGSLWNMYGPTETTIWSAVHQIHPGQPVRIGRPIANTQFYIVDSHLQPVPIGVPGELLIGGHGVGRGYLNRPELTEERFIADPFQQQPGARLYRTGDLARFLQNGEVEFLGRMDHQVKIRGYRIELGEIEAVLNRHPAVKQSAAMVHEIGPGDARLTAYVVPINAANASMADLRTFLQKELPDFMVPSSFHFLKTLPMTPNGKIDRKALPTVLSATPEQKQSTVPPRNDIEKEVARIWSKLLGVDSISVKDDFFDLGGHSLLAVRLFAELEKQFEKKLPLATLFQARTLEQLAQALQKETSALHWSSLAAIEARGSKEPLFLVHGAEGNVLLYRSLARHLSEDHPIYGLQSKGLSGKEDFLETFEDMAAHYIKEIKRVRPEGPYYLGGYCLGGAIALEMAQQLKAEGEHVPLVAMFETYNPRAVLEPPSRPLAFFRLLQNTKYHCANLLLIPSGNRRQFSSEKWKVASERLRIRLDAWAHAVSRSRRLKDGTSHAHLAAKRANDRALIQYRPRPYSGRVVLFRPKQFFLGLDDPEFGWGDVVRPGLEVCYLPFYPKGMLVEPFVQVLAHELNRCLSAEASGTTIKGKDTADNRQPALIG